MGEGHPWKTLQILLRILIFIQERGEGSKGVLKVDSGKPVGRLLH